MRVRLPVLLCAAVLLCCCVLLRVRVRLPTCTRMHSHTPTCCCLHSAVKHRPVKAGPTALGGRANGLLLRPPAERAGLGSPARGAGRAALRGAGLLSRSIPHMTASHCQDCLLFGFVHRKDGLRG